MKKKIRNVILALTLSAGIFTATSADAAKPIMLETQGSYAIGGSTVQHDGTFSTKNFLSPEGQKTYADSSQGINPWGS